MPLKNNWTRKADKADILTKEQTIAEIRKETDNSVKTTTDTCAKDILREVEERDRRRNNVMIFKVSKLLGVPGNERTADDTTKLKKSAYTLELIQDSKCQTPWTKVIQWSNKM